MTPATAPRSSKGETHPTLEQYLAEDSLRHITVAAGAGSGKTRALTQRYVRLISERDCDLANLLVVTFTEKAAAEMRGRIRAALRDKIRQYPHDSPERARLLDLIEHFYRCQISTFHAFCGALLREHPLEADLDPDYLVLEGLEQHRLLDDCVSRRLDRLAKGDPPSPALSKVLQIWRRSDLTRELARLVGDRFRILPWAQQIWNSNIEDHVANLRYVRDHLLSQFRESLLKGGELNLIAEQIARLEPDPEKSEAQMSQRRRELLNALAQIQSPQLSDAEFQQTILGTAPLLAQTGNQAKTWSTIKEEYKVVTQNLKTLLEFDYLSSLSLSEADLAIEREAFPYLQAVAVLLREVMDEYDAAKSQRNALDFADLQLRALAMLLNPKNSALLAKLRRRFRYILVDEQQDTDRLQWNLLRLLASDDSGQLAPAMLFIVGDEKQSIYAFRGADVTVFEEVRAAIHQANIRDQAAALPFQWPREVWGRSIEQAWGSFDSNIQRQMLLGDLRFHDNFRSAPTLIRFFNQFFRPVFERAKYAPFEAQPQSLRAARQDDIAGSVTIALVEKNATPARESENAESDGEDPGPYYREAELVAEQIAHALHGADPDFSRVRAARDKGEPAVALLFRRRTEMQWYITALRRHAIPFSVVKGRGFYSCQEIWDLLNALEFLADPRQDIALVGLLRSPLLGLSDDTIYLASRVKGRTFIEKFRRLLDDPESLLSRAIPTRDLPLAKRAIALLDSWLFKKSRLPTALLLRTIIEDSAYRLTLSLGRDGPQKIANVEKLLDRARSFDLGRVRGPSEFITQLRDLVSAEEAEGEGEIDLEQAAPVLLMTIHAAKGLQFPMVVLPDLGSRLNKSSGSQKLRFEEFYMPNADGTNLAPVALAGLQIPRGFGPSDKTALSAWLARQNARKTFAEYRRLLYVGATRAEDHLVLAGQLERDGDGGIKQPKSAENPNSLMDWVARHMDLREWPATETIPLPGGANESPIPIQLRMWHKNRPLPTVAEPPQFDEEVLAQEIEKRTEGALQRSTLALEPLEAQRVHRLSPTSLMTYRRCPRQFFYRNVLRLSPATLGGRAGADDSDANPAGSDETNRLVEREDDAILSPQDKALLLGLLVHRAIEMGEADLDWFRAEAPRLNAAHSDEESASLSADQFSTIAAAAFEHVKRFQETPRGKKLLAPTITQSNSQLLKERAFRHRLEKVEFAGQIDCLYFDAEDQEWFVVDYKTNLIRGGNSIESIIERHGYDTQLLSYAWAASRALGRPVRRAVLIFTDAGDERVFEFSDEHLREFERTLQRVSGQIEACEFPTREGEGAPVDSVCSSCIFGIRGVCEKGESGAALAKAAALESQ